MVEVFDSDADLKTALNMCRLDRVIVCRVSTSTLACEIVLRTGAIALVDSLTAAAYQSRGIAIVNLPDLPARSVSLLRPRLRPVSIFADAFVRPLLLEPAKFEAASP